MPNSDAFHSLNLDSLRPRGLGGYADLLLALATGAERGLAATAELLGYAEQADTHHPRDREPFPVSGGDPGEEHAGVVEEEVASRPRVLTPFWRLERRIFLGPLEPIPPAPPQPEWQGLPPLPSAPPLGRWQALVPRLRGAFTEWADGREPDIATMIRRLGKGRLLHRVPRRKRRRWGGAVQIIVDRSQRLIPFWADQDRAACRLAALFPRHGVEFALVLDESCQPVAFAANGSARDYRVPGADTLVVVLGDLGGLAGQPRHLMETWESFGRELRAAGCRVAALTPCPPSRWWPDSVPSWTLVPWERRCASARPTRAELDARAERLLALLSPAIRIEPGLLREVRLLLGAEADGGTEADVWQHPALSGHSSVAGTLNPKAAERLRETFAQLPADLRGKALVRLRQWRGGGLASEVWFEELLSLDPEVIDGLPKDLRDAIRNHDLPAARRFWIERAADLVEHDADARAWYSGVHGRASQHYHAQPDPALRAVQQRMYLSTFRDTSNPPPPSSGFDPALVPGDSARERDVVLWHQGNAVVAAETGAGLGAGSPLATVRTANGLVTITEEMEEEEDRAAFWKTGRPPPWAADWGWDGFGAWVTFSVTGADGAEPITQRLRWVPSGRFLMGSPEGEVGRLDREGPQHSVAISRGFWLMDTVCTQGLWQAVMGANPSRFKISPDHPVERVSWDDAQGFLARINARVPGLGLSLPTEAQWEYACRAGTATPFSFGATITLEQVNYGGRAKKTVPVASLPANPWGLHEMHGNVWEWCLDGMRNYAAEAVTDPHGPLNPGGDRVIRGGPVDRDARYARAAYRDGNHPDDHSGILGFRCMPVQGEGGAEPADPARVREAERRTAQGRPSGAVLRLDRDGLSSPPEAGAFGAQGLLPKARSFRILTDRERLSFGRITQPDWATGMGRDRFGLWASFAVPVPDGAEPITQRLRWVPPGRFLMGSPEDEPGRDDDEGPQHSVTISRGFWLMDTACTQGLWQAVMGANPSQFKISPDHPVERVSWNDVRGFLARINARVPGLGLSLPTEAQWEYACRAGTDTPFSFGATITPEQVNYGGRVMKTVPVASLPANPWGLYEMQGNVWEWCLDGMRPYEAKSETDPHGSSVDSGGDRVMRGGSWGFNARFVRAAHRFGYHPVNRSDDLGFRCARVQP